MMDDGYSPLPHACRFNSYRIFGEEDAETLSSSWNDTYWTLVTNHHEHILALSGDIYNTKGTGVI
jgi:hypothetical protein